MRFLECIIASFFEEADNLVEAFLDIFLSFYGLGYVAVRTLITILS